MRKSEMIEKIHNICKSWENCKIEKRMAEEILSMLEKEDVIIPPEIHGVYNPLLTPATVNPSGTIDQGFHRAWESEE